MLLKIIEELGCLLMAIHVENLEIKSYRGIRDLKIDSLGNVNILVGDNNSGKTSALEAIQILCNPNKYDLIRLARQRENYRSALKRMGILESFLHLFDVKNKDESYSLKIAGEICGKLNQVNVTGELVEQLVDLSELEEKYTSEVDPQAVSTQEEFGVLVGKIVLKNRSSF